MVVESVSAVVFVSAVNTITIVKPSGLVVGDLLVASLTAAAADGTGSGTVTTLAGWTLAIATSHSGGYYNNIQYKIADAGDVAASNFTFTKSTSTDQFIGQLYRVSGHNTLDPLGTAQTYEDVGASSTSFEGTMTSYTPGADGAFVLMQVGGEWSAGGSVRTVSNYDTVTTGITWTEGMDKTANDGGGGYVTASAYGIQSTAAALTEYTATVSLTLNDHYGQIAVFLPPIDASGSNTLVTTSAVDFSQTGKCDGVIDNTLATTTSEAFTQTGTAGKQAVWTNPDKITTNWTNPDK